ncbi:MAG: response regulator transcription factor [Caldilineales bacterium]|nr:response regulator transcription factor [Caldilineales bacterium]
MAYQILIVDDDALMRRSLSLQLEQAGYRTTTAASGEDALALIQRDRPDLVLLDVGLPGMDGLETIRRIHQEMDIPVIFVTARRREFDEILGLELGADEYITKPFNPDVLQARIKAVLRRTSRQDTRGSARDETLEIGDLIIDPAAHEVTVGGRPVELTAREFALLHVLALEAGKVVALDDLIARVWGAEFLGEPQVVYVHMRWLREKIEADPNKPQRIVNVRGVGYKLVPQMSDQARA